MEQELEFMTTDMKGMRKENGFLKVVQKQLELDLVDTNRQWHSDNSNLTRMNQENKALKNNLKDVHKPPLSISLFFRSSGR